MRLPSWQELIILGSTNEEIIVGYRWQASESHDDWTGVSAPQQRGPALQAFDGLEVGVTGSPGLVHWHQRRLAGTQSGTR